MTRRLIAPMAFALLALATQAGAACGWFGTQLECDLGRSLLTIGTQKAAEPDCAGALGAQPLQGCEGLPSARAVPQRPFTIGLQNVAVDPELCRRFGSETYCY